MPKVAWAKVTNGTPKGRSPADFESFANRRINNLDGARRSVTTCDGLPRMPCPARLFGLPTQSVAIGRVWWWAKIWAQFRRRYFFPALIFAQRARWAAAILRLPAADILRRGVFACPVSWLFSILCLRADAVPDSASRSPPTLELQTKA